LYSETANAVEYKLLKRKEGDMREEECFVALCDTVDTLLGENGCPWDKAQTHESLRSDLLEESYEVVDAIDQKDMPGLCEELGDLLLHVVMHSRIAEREGYFNLSDVVKHVTEKLVRRHSHIFGDDEAISPEEAEKTWEANKIKEKALFTPLENMKAVPKALPALDRTQKVIKRSEKEFNGNFDEMRILLDKLEKSTIKMENMENIGRILFFIAMISTKMQINAELSLTNATQEFINSFE